MHVHASDIPATSRPAGSGARDEPPRRWRSFGQGWTKGHGTTRRRWSANPTSPRFAPSWHRFSTSAKKDVGAAARQPVRCVSCSPRQAPCGTSRPCFSSTAAETAPALSPSAGDRWWMKAGPSSCRSPPSPGTARAGAGTTRTPPGRRSAPTWKTAARSAGSIPPAWSLPGRPRARRLAVELAAEAGMPWLCVDPEFPRDYDFTPLTAVPGSVRGLLLLSSPQRSVPGSGGAQLPGFGQDFAAHASKALGLLELG